MIRIRTASAEGAVPTGRIPYDMRGSAWLVHTVQDAAVLDRLLVDGVYEPDPARGEPEFSEAYDWMYRQMASRLGARSGAAIWFWVATTRRVLVDQCAVAAKSEGESVLLTCRIPRERLLPSHFGDWHMVLNRGLHVPPRLGESDEAWEARWEPLMEAFYARLDALPKGDERVMASWPTDLLAEVESSWESIFDPGIYMKEPNRLRWPGHWQAVATSLYASDVLDAVRLV